MKFQSMNYILMVLFRQSENIFSNLQKRKIESVLYMNKAPDIKSVYLM